MAEYAMNIAKQAKTLTPPMSEAEIIRCVKRHFGNSVMREIRPTTVKNIDEFVKLLDEIEYERKLVQKNKFREDALKSGSDGKDGKFQNNKFAIQNERAKPRDNSSKQRVDQTTNSNKKYAIKYANKNYAKRENFKYRDKNKSRVKKVDEDDDEKRDYERQIIPYDRDLAIKQLKKDSGNKGTPCAKKIASIVENDQSGKAKDVKDNYKYSSESETDNTNDECD